MSVLTTMDKEGRKAKGKEKNEVKSQTASVILVIPASLHTSSEKVYKTMEGNKGCRLASW